MPPNALATVPQNDGAQLTAAIVGFASDPTFDVDKLRAMLDMKRELDAMAAEQAYNLAMKACQEEMRPVVREKMNTHTRAKYATLEQLHESLKPVWLKHGFSLSSHSDVSPMPGHYRVVTTCRHTGGHKTTHFLDAPPDDAGPKGEKNKTPIQALGSTVSYVRRYLDLMIFDVTLVGEDRDGNREVQYITQEQVATLNDWMIEKDVKLDDFLKWAETDSLAKLPVTKYTTAIQMLKDRKQGARR